MLALGDDTARRSDSRAGRARPVAIAVGTALAAVATALAGPVAFVALRLAPIARRSSATGSRRCSPPRSWALSSCRLRPRRPAPLPGIAGAGRHRHRVVGAPYLIWLLARGNRKGSDGSTRSAPPGPVAVPSRRGARPRDGPRPWLRAASRPGDARRRMTVIVGANGCGKSTLLRGLGRLLRPVAGRVLLDGDDLRSLSTRQVAAGRWACCRSSRWRRRAITVGDLVGRGRLPAPGAVPALDRRGRRRSSRDALAVTGTPELADRRDGRALRRSAAAGLDRDGAGPAARHPAARRADDVPRRRPPDRDARPARRARTASAAPPS